MPSALVTGSAGRVGRAIALELARAGFDVFVHANASVDAARETAEEIGRLGRRAFVTRADLSEEGGPASLAEQVRQHTGALELLVHNAAAYEHARLEEVSRARLDHMLAVNVAAPFFLTQALLPELRAAAGACVVSITDAALVRPYSTIHRLSHYLASKAALEQLTRAWALELAPAIRVNAVAPGPVAIGDATSAEERGALLARTPLGREGSFGDVASAVAFLARVPYVTGQVLAVDGGLGIA